jgi:3-oxoacyl-[acyl-carrier protein] reductase
VRFSETAAQETLDLGIRINCIAPGSMNTDMNRAIIAAGEQRVGSEYQRALEQEQKGNASPEPAAALAVFLASSAATGITGRLLSAIWDPWPRLAEHAAELQATDIYTLRRIVPADRGKNWP